MKILFSPSEGKTSDSPITKPLNTAFFQPSLFSKREEVIHRYENLLKNGSFEKLSKLFGLKDSEAVDTLRAISITSSALQEAILRYTGVAYDYLSYNTLPKESQAFIKTNTIIFSNLLGPLLAGDAIPNYKLKQGEKIDGFAPEKHYKETFSPSLDTFLENELIIDLRAGFYEKFYTIPFPYITCKFLKNGKSVSHWAKAYRGMVVRALAIHQPQTEEEFAKMAIEGLAIKEIIQTKLKREYVFDIIS